MTEADPKLKQASVGDNIIEQSYNSLTAAGNGMVRRPGTPDPKSPTNAETQYQQLL